MALPCCCAYKVLVGQSPVIYKLLRDKAAVEKEEKNTMHRENKIRSKKQIILKGI